MAATCSEIIINRILKIIPQVWAIYRFGSAGTPFERPDSDIDLAILAPNPLDNLARWELAQSLAISLNKDVDLVDLQLASTVLRHQIVSHG
jgi:predicted nucleotidyltransferase